MMGEALSLLLDARKSKRRGLAAMRERQGARLAEIVAHAREHSPFYRRLYRDLPPAVDDVSVLPVTDKKKLMASFDEWATDRDVTLEKAREFVADLSLVGERFLGKYTVATTSGTTGTPAIFLLDDRTLAVTKALAFRMGSAWLGPRDVVKILRRGGRTTMVCATGGHYAEAVAAARLRRSPWRARALQVLSAHMPLPEMVAELNRFRPAILAPYAGIGAQLAGELDEGRLAIDPAVVVLSAEGLPDGGYGRISAEFGVIARHSYAATECMFISYSCGHDWLHVNTDWVVLEPVDTDHRPVPPGELSHTVLLTNLANRAQPILRYDIGDRVVRRPDPCPCGDPLPAIRVQGRTAEVLTFPTAGGQRVVIPALTFEIVDALGIELYQIVHVDPLTLRVRLRAAAGTDPERAWQAVHAETSRLLAERELGHVVVQRAKEPPEQSRGGKYRAVIPMTQPAPSVRPADAETYR